MASSDVLGRSVPRRTLLQIGAVSAAAIGGGALRPVLVRASDGTPAPQAATPEGYAPATLTSHELETLQAATDRLIPPDENGPGATDAGVYAFIDRTLGGADAALLPIFQAGLAALDAAAPSSFAAATFSEQAAILGRAEAGELDDDPGGFFGILLEYTRQGMFCDPVHGGNIGFAGWDLIGYPGIKLLWTEADQAVDATVEPEHVSVAQYRGGEE